MRYVKQNKAFDKSLRHKLLESNPAHVRLDIYITEQQSKALNSLSKKYGKSKALIIRTLLDMAVSNNA
jgi:hypothetical protein